MDPIDKLSGDFSQLALTSTDSEVAKSEDLTVQNRKLFHQKYALISPDKVALIFSGHIASYLDFDSCCAYAMTCKALWEKRVTLLSATYHALSTRRVQCIVQKMLRERAGSSDLAYFDEVLTQSIRLSKSLNTANLQFLYRFTQGARRLSMGDQLFLQVYGNSLTTLVLAGLSKTISRSLSSLHTIGSTIRDLRITLYNQHHDPDIFITKIVTLFPNLESFYFNTSRLVREDGYSALCLLHNLRKLYIGCGNCAEPSLTRLAGRLERLWLASGLAHVSCQDVIALRQLPSLYDASLGLRENTALNTLWELEGHEGIARLEIHNISLACLEGLSFLRTLPSLQSLSLSASEWRYKALMALNTLSLSYLEMGGSVNASTKAWTSFSESACMDTLQTLIMYRPRNLSSFHFLKMASAPRMQTLVVYDSDLVSHPENPMCDQNSLRSLTFIQCHGVDDSLLSRFAFCPLLKELNIIESGNVSGEFLLAEGSFPSLHDLFISLSGRTSRAVFERLAALPVEVLDLRGSNNLSFRMIELLFKSTTIKRLYLPQGDWYELEHLFKRHPTIGAIYTGGITYNHWTDGTVSGYKKERNRSCFRLFSKR